MHIVVIFEKLTVRFCKLASVFGEQRRFEPMEEERKARWKREIDWLLSVTEHIVEFVPTQQTLENGTTIEVKSLSCLISKKKKKDLYHVLIHWKKKTTMYIVLLC